MPAELELTTLTDHFLRRLGMGGRCSECDHALLVVELLAEDER